MILFCKQSNFDFKGRLPQIANLQMSERVLQWLAAKMQDCNIKTFSQETLKPLQIAGLRPHLQYLSRILLKLFLLFIVSHHSWWLYTWTWTAGWFWRRFGFLLKKKINTTLNCFTECHNRFVDSNFHDSLNSASESRSTYYSTSHNYNKILKSDWLSTVLTSALIGQYASCLSIWTVCIVACVHFKGFFTANKNSQNFLCFNLKKPKISH